MADRKPIVLVSGQLQQIQTGDTVPVANGGTGATDASGARTNLGVAIGTDVQAFDADLSALAALASNGVIVRTGAGTAAVRTITGTASNISVTNGDGVSGNPTINLVDAGTPVSDQFVKITTDAKGRVTATSAVSASDIGGVVDTRYVRKDQDSTLANGVTIVLDSGTTSFTDNDLVPKRYVDGVAAGLDWKASVRVASTANVAIATGLENGDTLDGITLATGDRVLLKNQSTAAENGIYVVVASGAASRATDADSSSEVTSGMTVWVEQGTTNADTAWTLVTDGAITLGSTSLSFTQTSGLGQITAGAGLTKTGNTIDIATAASTRITVNADNIDLGQPTIGGSGAAANITKVTVDVYGRVTNTGTATAADVGAQPADATLTALAAYNTNGLLTQTAADTFAGRSIATADSGRITVSNGNGVAGNPTLDLASGIVAPGTYTQVTVDTYGRVTAGSAGSGGESTATTLTNNTGSTIAIVNAVYTSGNGEITKAIANADAASKAIGLTAAAINNGASGSVVTAGVVTATTGEWDANTGQSGGLTTGADYFLDNATAGKITTTAPGTGYVQRVGHALSTTKLKVDIGPRVQL